MDPLSFVKVIMLTAFLSSGVIIYEERTETTLTLCEQAREEATSFNNRFRWPWVRYSKESRRVYIVCLHHFGRRI